MSYHPRPRRLLRRQKSAWWHKCGPREGQALDAKRKGIGEPVLGQIQEARGFRRFLLRGLQKIRGEWRLVCLGHHRLKLWRYGSAQSAASTTGKITLWC
jgi:hypothetical protein